MAEQQTMRQPIESEPWRFQLDRADAFYEMPERKAQSVAIYEEIFDSKSADYLPKPHRSTYDRFIDDVGVAPRRAAMFEDIIRNLEAPHDLGMGTVLVHDNDNEDGAMINKLNDDTGDAEHVHHVTDDLAAFLSTIVPE